MLDKIIKILFIITGTKFYLDWILITNPTSKNPIIRFFYNSLKNEYTATNYKKRYNSCYVLGTIHVIFFFLLFWLDGWTISLINLLVNVYPIFVQFFIGYRLRKIIKHKKSLNDFKIYRK